MDAAAKKIWVEALRSGEYKQGRGALCVETDGETRYCPLGVAYDVLAEKDWVWTSFSPSRSGWGTERGENGRLDVSIPDSIGLGFSYQDELIEMNDGQKLTFEKIADWIEENL